jgi:hypothetical protein
VTASRNVLALPADQTFISGVTNRGGDTSVATFLGTRPQRTASARARLRIRWA